jgi:hypothetical protein
MLPNIITIFQINNEFIEKLKHPIQLADDIDRKVDDVLSKKFRQGEFNACLSIFLRKAWSV